jgi:hypothetical protein
VVRNTFDKFYCALSQLPSRYPHQQLAERIEELERRSAQLNGQIETA